MTRLERARKIRDVILAWPDESWTTETIGGPRLKLIRHEDWTVALTDQSHRLIPEGSPELENNRDAEIEPWPTYVLDVWITGRGKVLSLSCGLREDRLISMSPGPWEQSFGITADEQRMDRRPLLDQDATDRWDSITIELGREASSVQSIDTSLKDIASTVHTPSQYWEAREARCRRQAAKHNLKLRKSCRARDKGFYGLVDMRTNVIVYGSDGQGNYCASLEDIERYFAQ